MLKNITVKNNRIAAQQTEDIKKKLLGRINNIPENLILINLIIDEVVYPLLESINKLDRKIKKLESQKKLT